MSPRRRSGKGEKDKGEAWRRTTNDLIQVLERTLTDERKECDCESQSEERSHGGKKHFICSFAAVILARAQCTLPCEIYGFITAP